MSFIFMSKNSRITIDFDIKIILSLALVYFLFSVASVTLGPSIHDYLFESSVWNVSFCILSSGLGDSKVETTTGNSILGDLDDIFSAVSQPNVSLYYLTSDIHYPKVISSLFVWLFLVYFLVFFTWIKFLNRFKSDTLTTFVARLSW